jgi:hypothetical protein
MNAHAPARHSNIGTADESGSHDVPDPSRDAFNSITDAGAPAPMRDMSCCARAVAAVAATIDSHRAQPRRTVENVIVRKLERVGPGFAPQYPSRRPAVPIDLNSGELMASSDNEQGKKPNVEGRHGDKTHSAFLEGLQGAAPTDDAATASRLGDAARPTDDGRHRLSEDREQHDEAEKNSEYNRLSR